MIYNEDYKCKVHLIVAEIDQPFQIQYVYTWKYMKIFLWNI